MSTRISTFPTVTVRKSNERGQANYGWLDTRYTFSFANYHDPAHTGYRNLQVINDDKVSPGQGFGTHPHRNAEIFTYILDGRLEHKDSMGNGRVIQTGEFQYMSAGCGVKHSEFNPSATQPVHLLQIWLKPDENGGQPRYQQKKPGDFKANALTLMASGRAGWEPDSSNDAPFGIRARAEIFMGKAEAGQAVEVSDDEEHPYAWIHVFRGAVALGDTVLSEGDAASLQSTEGFAVTAQEDAQFLLFRLA